MTDLCVSLWLSQGQPAFAPRNVSSSLPIPLTFGDAKAGCPSVKPQIVSAPQTGASSVLGSIFSLIRLSAWYKAGIWGTTN